MNRKKIIYIIIAIIILIAAITIVKYVFFSEEANYNITGEYKLIKVEQDDHDIDYSNLNFYYIFYENNTGKIIFDEVSSTFKYEIEKVDDKYLLKLSQNDKETTTYTLIVNEKNLTISNDILGTLKLEKADVPNSLKK